MSEPNEDPKETPLVSGTYTITSAEPLQTITGPRVSWTGTYWSGVTHHPACNDRCVADSHYLEGDGFPEDDPTVGQVDPT